MTNEMCAQTMPDISLQGLKILPINSLAITIPLEMQYCLLCFKIRWEPITHQLTQVKLARMNSHRL